jgi:subtilisin family serine protease
LKLYNGAHAVSRTLLLALTLILAASTVLADHVAADPTAPASLLHLRRGTFDPLAKMASAARSTSVSGSSLLLVQFEQPPSDTTVAALGAAGLRPLWYIPDNAYLVRPAPGARADSLPGVRWVGAFDAADKRAPELDAAIAAPPEQLNLQLVAAPDADTAPLIAAIGAWGGAVLTASDGLTGAHLRVALPGVALAALLERDDVLWAEPYLPATTFDDRARALAGVPAAVDAFGLTGAGQTVAVTDTGLDIQDDLSADFTGRVARGFSRAQMFAPCAALSPAQEPNTWSDLHGHGTHVAGTVVGTGALSGGRFAGMAPAARLVLQSVSSGSDRLDCLPDAEDYLQLAYDAGARIHNGSFGRRTGGGSCEFGCYTGEDASVDDFLWRNKDYLFVVAAGNGGRDINAPFGVIDPDSITSPATAKNVLTVGASENDRPGASGCWSGTPERTCWAALDPTNSSGLRNAPFATDQISDNSAGMAAFSGRGPTDDGRIKPEIVAPGTNVIAARSHYPGVSYGSEYDTDYAYLSGTSMATPQVSGFAALTRQWLVERRQLAAPSAALVKALLINGAVSLRPGQYVAGDEIPAGWPNAVEGWGRASIAETVAAGRSEGVWFQQHAGLRTGTAAEYSLGVQAGAPLRFTLVWTDYPAAAGAGKALVNDLDLEVITPGGTQLLGNASAPLPSTCRSAGADRCNTVESVELLAPVSGTYLVRVRGATIPQGPQPFAVVAHASHILDRGLAAPQLRAAIVSGASVALNWSSVPGALSYRVEIAASSSFSAPVETIVATSPSLMVIQDLGTRYVRVKACASSGCGEYSNTQQATVTVAPRQVYAPAVLR